ncbi:hypothetical protein ABT272_31240 [Streptomyces sp900105245]|uniref:Uncharacterized protein n=1 Tax=Streptomyces sp. 900105245 TaxID=3154379 RepID=A0ABV1UEM3_9ACTN
MNATPQSPHSSEREELFRLLPAPADPDLSRDRHRLLKEHLMNHVQEESRLTARRWRLATRVAAPLALAAAVAGVAVSVGQTSGNTTTGTVAAGPDRISNVAYTLDREPNSTVKMSLRVKGGEMKCIDGKCTTPGEAWPGRTRVVADPAALQHDLDRMGVNARVYRDDPACSIAQQSLNRDKEASRSAVGKVERVNDQLVATIHRDKIPDGSTLVVVLPSGEGKDQGLFGTDVLKGDLPSCYHAQKAELP